MSDKEGFLRFSNSSIDSASIFPHEENGENENCICGPKPCKLDAISIDKLSLDSVDDVEVVDSSLWESILRKSKEKILPYTEWLEERRNSELSGTPQDGPIEFLEKKLFPLLLPAIRIMLMQAQDWEALKIQKCRFNGLDFLAEFLWNRNPRYPKRSRRWMELYSIPPFRLFLKLNPRPIFPKSWLWTREEGALMIQKWVRGWLVRKREDVQEMRLFWKAIIAEMERKAMELGITYSEFVKNRSQEGHKSPCDRYREK